MQSNLAITHENLGRLEEASRLKRDVYTGFSELFGDEHKETLREGNNYANSLIALERFEEAKALMRKTVPVARRVLGENDKTTLRARWMYAEALYMDTSSTLDDLREAVTTLEDAGRIARRVFSGAHPITAGVGRELHNARAALRARETPGSS